MLGIAQLPLLTAALVRRGHDAGVPAAVSLVSPALYAVSLVILALNIPVLTEHVVSAQSQASLLIQTAFRMPQLAIGLLQLAALVLGLVIGLRPPLRGRNPYGRGAFNVQA